MKYKYQYTKMDVESSYGPEWLDWGRNWQHDWWGFGEVPHNLVYIDFSLTGSHVLQMLLAEIYVYDIRQYLGG